MLFSLAMAHGFAADLNKLGLIPVPQKVESHKGVFRWQPGTRIITDKASQASAKYLAEQVRKSTGYRVVIRFGGESTTATGITPSSEVKLLDLILVGTEIEPALHGDLHITE